MSQNQNDHSALNSPVHPEEKHGEPASSAPPTNVFAAMDEYMNSTEEPESSHESIRSSMPDSHAAPDPEALADFRPTPGATSTADPAALLPNAGSMALSQVPKERRPRPSTVCEVCPASLWTASPHDVQCWCRIMHFTSWSTSAPYHRIACDGIAIASEQA